MTSPPTHQPEQYTRITCDNVVWDRFKREHVRCDRLLLRLRPGDVLTTPVEVVCTRCGRRQWVGGEVDRAA